MKVSSFLLSKKLAEIGFKADYIFTYDAQQDFAWKEHHAMFGKEPLIPAYDLETLIDALPNFIANGSGTENCLVIDVAFGEIHYEGDSENDALFITTTGENESLADCAARLLIKLHEQGLIKFEVVND